MAKATPEAVFGLSSAGAAAAILESVRPRLPEGPEPQLKLEFLLRCTALMVWGPKQEPDSLRVGGVWVSSREQ